MPYIGGICRFWYIPIQDIDVWPTISPATQMLTGEPTLKAGKTWYGPVNVANDELGLSEDQLKTTAGIYYKRTLQGLIQGTDSDSDINLANHAPYQFAVVAELRAGGYFKFFGSEEIGMELDHTSSTGIGSMDVPGSKFSLADECKFKGFILPAFAGINSTPPPTGGGGPTGGTSSGHAPEIITFTTTDLAPTFTFAWTPARLLSFGTFPTIQVWIDNGSGSYQIQPSTLIACDQEPPNTTNFLIDMTGAADGFVVIK